MTSRWHRYLLFRRLCFFFFIPFASAWRLRPGRWTSTLCSFFRGKMKAKRWWLRRGAVPCFFWDFVPPSSRKDIHVLFSEKKEEQKTDNVQGYSYLSFRHFFVSFLRRKKRRKGKPKGGELPFRRFCLFFLKREKENQKRRTKSRAVAEEYRHLSFLRFPSLFYLLKE